MTKNKLSYSLISKYRSVLMGIAIICILLCHLYENRTRHGAEQIFLSKLFIALTAGVDIFMFLSGYGLYFSLKGKQFDYLPYIKRRVSRIIPSYVIIAGITWIITDLIVGHLGIWRLLGDFFFVTMFTRGVLRYWYVFAIIVYYLIFPVVFFFVERDYKHPNLICFVFLAVFWITTKLLHKMMPNYEDLDLAIERLPVFVLGVICGKMSKKKKGSVSSKYSILAMILGFGVAALYLGLSPFKKIVRQIHYGYYFTRGMFAIAIIIAVILFMEYTEKRQKLINSFVFKVMAYLGGITLEIYLFHQSFRALLNQPYTLPGYFAGAVIAPVIAAAFFNSIRLSIKKSEAH